MKILLSLSLLLVTLPATARAATEGLVVHGAELATAKFHRLDNQRHAYGAEHAWAPYILPAQAGDTSTFTAENADGSVTVFFSNLEDFLTQAARVASEKHTRISVLNILAHGLPGVQWFPSDRQALTSSDCSQWRDMVSADDSQSYNQYYSAVPVDEIKQIRAMADSDVGQFMGCVTGLNEWKMVVGRVPAIRDALAPDAQIHILSCVTGLGESGKNFVQGLASLLLPSSGGGHVEASMKFGLGDWSMPRGMGFWDYVTDAQVDHDNEIYPRDRQDSEIMQKGDVRIAQAVRGEWISRLLPDQDLISLKFRAVPPPSARIVPEAPVYRGAVPSAVRIPGTGDYVRRISL